MAQLFESLRRIWEETLFGFAVLLKQLDTLIANCESFAANLLDDQWVRLFLVYFVLLLIILFL